MTVTVHRTLDHDRTLDRDPDINCDHVNRDHNHKGAETGHNGHVALSRLHKGLLDDLPTSLTVTVTVNVTVTVTINVIVTVIVATMTVTSHYHKITVTMVSSGTFAATVINHDQHSPKSNPDTNANRSCTIAATANITATILP